MVFGFEKSAKHREVGPQELAGMVAANQVLVVDVREVDEFASGHIPGSINMPLSTFQPSKLPAPGARQLVLTCLGGKRSGMALDKCAAAQASVDTHLAGGFGAWAKAGLPVER
ncbi:MULTISPECIES: rhodanese-like domain-containing protein [unclassified Novosphingobium]|uniref:rhodanese-like domain-containing protein n=1 Tax=unclassified Novosphingobium TaxID=2644732 RepID=UPI001494C37C|nr:MULTISPECIES: rhodanese-like domain-containing protein [unclassified Novosphingobium]MBB3374363.1 rhodanese-related sulfurtransferase [Novosphingobium sp. BK280]MBB3378775.1 rhodanese-related sulfurtransferase [Novosphingobium sp. BK258]MBB3448409.1 rhodanese-related sulfurtransferase [Novosphingobium sp. BK352]MBB3477813.1 rhodanese-related sulfurtransferase [Novosphingobium sp. BK369]MBB3501123.1 rhodanese-related sulfurtransferase [Novosphingobium sp. BK336]